MPPEMGMGLITDTAQCVSHKQVWDTLVAIDSLDRNLVFDIIEYNRKNQRKTHP